MDEEALEQLANNTQQECYADEEEEIDDDEELEE